MKTYFPLLIASIIMLSFQYSTIQSNLDKDYLFVMAPSGLKMRATPNGKKLLIISYNAKVERLDKESYGTLTVEEIKGFNISGDWVKVKYNGQIGYVFDGYLTQFVLPEKGIEYEDYKTYTSEYDYYLKKNFKPSSKRYALIKQEKEEDCVLAEFENCVCGYSQDFSSNITYSYWHCGEAKGLEENLKIEGVTLSEAYFMVRVINPNSETYYNGKKQEPKEIIIYDRSKKTIEIAPEGAGCGTTIKQTDTGVEISMFCGC